MVASGGFVGWLDDLGSDGMTRATGISRRALLAASGVGIGVAAVAGCSNDDGGSRPAAPNADYPRLTFHDDFESLQSVDLTGKGRPGHLWFTDRPFGWGRTTARELKVADGVLTISPTSAGTNYNLATVSSVSGAGSGWRHGYFEARMAFDPAVSGGAGWPALWMLPVRQIVHGDLSHSVEVDIFEAYPAQTRGRFSGLFTGTVHDFQLSPSQVHHADFGNNVAHVATDWAGFHTYGLLWRPGQLEWFFDNTKVLSMAFGASIAPSPNAARLPTGTFDALDSYTDGMALILGTGPGRQLRVDWVRIWQA